MPCMVPEEDIVSSETTTSLQECLFRYTSGYHKPYLELTFLTLKLPVCTQKSLACYFYASVESWICSLMIPFLHFNFVSSITACVSPLLKLQDDWWPCLKMRKWHNHHTTSLVRISYSRIGAGASLFKSNSYIYVNTSYIYIYICSYIYIVHIYTICTYIYICTNRVMAVGMVTSAL